MNRFEIQIDGRTYEGSDIESTAWELYETVDDTCLLEYDMHKKSLVSDGKVLAEETIHAKERQLNSETEIDEDEEDEEVHRGWHR